MPSWVLNLGVMFLERVLFMYERQDFVLLLSQTVMIQFQQSREDLRLSSVITFREDSVPISLLRSRKCKLNAALVSLRLSSLLHT